MSYKKNESQATSLQKSSTPELMKTYFQKVFELKQSGKDFPVDLDQVWPLVYGRKEESVRVLKADFIEGVDFQRLRKNAESNGKRGGDRRSEDYMLSVECLEYFIAKKVKAVFEVYRSVFHTVIFRSFLDLKPVNVNGAAFYEYSEVARRLGYSTHHSSLNGRRYRNPQEFCHFNGLWRVSEKYANHLKKNIEIKNGREEIRQRRISFIESNKRRQLMLFELGKGSAI